MPFLYYFGCFITIKYAVFMFIYKNRKLLRRKFCLFYLPMILPNNIAIASAASLYSATL